MCGRFAITLPPEAMRRLFGYVEQPNFPARYNIAPTQPIPVVRAERDEGAEPVRRFALMRWAFLPSFVKDPKDFPLIFNARSEGLADKASFRNALRRRRCLVPADAFYEWQRHDGSRQAPSKPWMARRADGETMGLAGLWETWMGPNGEEVDTVCIVTTSANAISTTIHPRLPVVIERREWAAWLDPEEAAADRAADLLRPPAEAVLTFVPIGDAIGKVANDGPELQEPIGPALDASTAPAPRAAGSSTSSEDVA